MFHTIRHSFVKYSLRRVRIMHLACCVGESVCATSHLPHVLPCRDAAGYATPAVRPPKGNQKFICSPIAAKRCMEEATKNKIDRCFFCFLTVGHNIDATLSERFGGFGSLYIGRKRSRSRCTDPDLRLGPGHCSISLFVHRIRSFDLF